MSNLTARFETEVGKYCKYIPIPTFDYSINISLKYNYFYTETPKVACSTIKTILQSMELNSPDFFREDFEDIHSRAFSPLLKPSQVGSFDKFISQPGLFKFCFSRNPYSRLLSAYLDKIKSNKSQKRIIIQQLGRDVSLLKQEISFAEFVDVVCEQNIFNMDPHWRVQYYQTFQDNINYDFIGKIESFDNDFKLILSKLNKEYLPFFTSEKRHATESNQLLKSYYTEALIEKVKAKYAIDFDYFGYNFEIETLNEYYSFPNAISLVKT